MVWDAAIACYLFLAGMGAGAFALSALAAFVKPEARKLRTIGYLIAPIAVAVGCVLLMVDAKGGLTNPLRFFHIVSNLQSVMAWGVIILCLFIVVSLITLIVMVKKKSTPKALDGIGLVLALATAAYTGVLLGAAPGFPLWNPVILPVLFVVSAASSGFAAVLLGTYLVGSEDAGKLGFTKVTGLVLPILEAVLIAALLVAGTMVSGSGAEAAAASVANMLSGSYAVPFWLGLVVIGLAVPIVLKVVRGKQGHGSGSPRNAIGVVGEACVLVGAFMLRFLVIMAAVPIFG